jgi:two-component system, cell cycle response regulator
VIAECAERLRKSMRGDDAVSRTGGEEFVVLAHGATPALTASLAERLRIAVAEQPFSISSTIAQHPDVTVTVSVGFAISNSDADAIAAARAQADGALYRAKRNGKNRVEG